MAALSCRARNTVTSSTLRRSSSARAVRAGVTSARIMPKNTQKDRNTAIDGSQGVMWSRGLDESVVAKICNFRPIDAR